MQNNLHDSYANQLYTLYSQTKGTRGRLIQQLSKYDKNLSAYYHDVEHLVISPNVSYDYMTALQNILIKRRAVKQEIYHLDIILRSLKASVDTLKAQRRLAIQREVDYGRTLNVNITINDVL